MASFIRVGVGVVLGIGVLPNPVAVDPVEFRKGIDGLAAIAR